MRYRSLTALSLVVLTACGDSLSAKAPKQAAPESTEFIDLTRQTNGPAYQISLAYPQMVCDGDSDCEAMNQVIRSTLFEDYIEDTRIDGANHQRQLEILNSSFEDYAKFPGEKIGLGFGSFQMVIYSYRCMYVTPDLVSIIQSRYFDQAGVSVSASSVNYWRRGGHIEEIQLADLFEEAGWEELLKPILMSHAALAMGHADPELISSQAVSYIQKDLSHRPFTFSAAGLQLHYGYGDSFHSFRSQSGPVTEVRIPLHELREHLDPDGPMARWL